MRLNKVFTHSYYLSVPSMENTISIQKAFHNHTVYLSKDQCILRLSEYNELCHPLISLRNKLRGNRAANVVPEVEYQGSEKAATAADISLLLSCPSETTALKPGVSDFLVKQLPKCQIPVSY